MPVTQRSQCIEPCSPVLLAEQKIINKIDGVAKDGKWNFRLSVLTLTVVSILTAGILGHYFVLISGSEHRATGSNLAMQPPPMKLVAP